MARNYGDVAAEFRALLTGCGIYDLRGRTKVVLTGSDRVRWLNGMTTNNVRDLAAGHGVYAFLLNPQGHIQARPLFVSAWRTHPCGLGWPAT